MATSLILVVFLNLLLYEAGESCTKGFMDMDLLRSKSAQIRSPPTNAQPSVQQLAEVVHGPTKWILHDKFSCQSTLREVLIGVDIRTETRIRYQYPSIEIWHRKGGHSYEKYQTERSFTINLTPDNFTTDGLYRYKLSTGLTVNRNDRLVVYQPASDQSIVRFYTVTGEEMDEIGLFDDINANQIKTSGRNIDVTWYNGEKILLQPILDNTNCYPSDSSFNTNSLSITSVIPVTDTRVFTDIHFTCSGIITNWLLPAIPITTHLVLRIRHTDNTTTTALNATLPSNSELYDIAMINEVSIKPGDVLMIASSVNNGMYYQKHNGPYNYQLGSNNVLTRMDSNDYPLISVIIRPTTPLMSSTMITSSSSTASTTIKTIDITPAVSSTMTTTSHISLTSSSTIIRRSTSTIMPSTLPSSTVTSSNIPNTSTASISSSNASLSSTTSSPSATILSSPTTVLISNAIQSTLVSSLMLTVSSLEYTTEASEHSVVVVTTSQLDSTSMTGSAMVTHSTEHNATISTMISSSPLNTSPLSSSASSFTSTPTVQGSREALPLSSILVAVISTVLILLIVSILVILIVSVLMYKRRKRLTVIISSEGNASLSNPVYSANTTYQEEKGISNPYYQIQGSGQLLYEDPKPVMNGIEAIYSETTTSHGARGNGSTPLIYEEPISTLKRQEASENEMYSLLEGATLYVPTADKRRERNIYFTLINDEEYSSYSRLDHNGTSGSFFIEDTEYWEPDTNTDGIYQQLSDRKYREIVRHQIKVTDHLGSGQFGTVNKGVWTTPTGSVPVAIKTLNDNTSEDERVKFLQEAAIMGQFHHSNVVKLHGVVTIGDPTMIILEFISGGDLKEYLMKFKPSPGELVLSSVPSILLSFCRQIASGMEYLSKKKFVHRDLAARNILVSTEGTGVCKIADFGMSRDLQDESYYISQSKKIPIKWTAPEALHYKKYSSASDVWSYGAVMYEIWSLGHKPFETHTNQECVRLVDSGYRLPPPPGCPKPIYKLMIQCWNPDNTQRPTFSSILSCLSVPNEKLLIINEKPVTVLGGALETSHTLYTDLQYMYK